MRSWEKRINDVELVLVNWMRNQHISFTTPDDCIDELIRQGIYKTPIGKDTALAFRTDLRSVRDTYGMPYDMGLIRIEQEAEYQNWYIYLK